MHRRRHSVVARARSDEQRAKNASHGELPRRKSRALLAEHTRSKRSLRRRANLLIRKRLSLVLMMDRIRVTQGRMRRRKRKAFH